MSARPLSLSYIGTLDVRVLSATMIAGKLTHRDRIKPRKGAEIKP